MADVIALSLEMLAQGVISRPVTEHHIYAAIAAKDVVAEQTGRWWRIDMQAAVDWLETRDSVAVDDRSPQLDTDSVDLSLPAAVHYARELKSAGQQVATPSPRTLRKWIATGVLHADRDQAGNWVIPRRSFERVIVQRGDQFGRTPPKARATDWIGPKDQVTRLEATRLLGKWLEETGSPNRSGAGLMRRAWTEIGPAGPITRQRLQSWFRAHQAHHARAEDRPLEALTPLRDREPITLPEAFELARLLAPDVPLTLHALKRLIAKSELAALRRGRSTITISQLKRLLDKFGTARKRRPLDQLRALPSTTLISEWELATLIRDRDPSIAQTTALLRIRRAVEDKALPLAGYKCFKLSVVHAWLVQKPMASSPAGASI